MSFRKEEKLNFAKSQILNLYSWISENEGVKIYDDRLVSSTYFDNGTMQMFKDSEEGTVPRKKIRIRSYDRLEHKIGSSAFEVKRSTVEGRYKTSTKNYELEKIF